MTYSTAPAGSMTPRDFYSDPGETTPLKTYPNGTVAQLVCEKDYTSDDGEEERLPSATCIMGGWTGIATTWGERVFDHCDKDRIDNYGYDYATVTDDDGHNGYEYPTVTDDDGTDNYGY